MNYEFHTTPEFQRLIENPEPQRAISFTKMQAVRENAIPYNACCLKNPQNIHESVKGLFHLADREMMLVLSLDTKNNPIAIEIAAMGQINVCAIDMRDLFKHCILFNAAHIICLHNHLSGGAIVISEPDIRTTKRIKEAGELLGIPMLDHIIIGIDDNYCSLAEAGYL